MGYQVWPLYARILYGMPVDAPHGARLEALVPNPLALSGLSEMRRLTPEISIWHMRQTLRWAMTY